MMYPITPKVAWLTVNRNCNFRCPWGYGRSTKYNPQETMNLSLATKLTDLMIDSGVQKLLLIGGEPTLWPHLFDINNYCKKRGIQTILVTNAMRFGTDSFWEKYIASPNDAVGISLKAGTAEKLTEITGVTQFDIVRKGITRAIDLFKTGVSLTYNAHYRGHLLDMAKLAIECGARFVKIDFCTTSFVDGTATNQDMIEPNELVKSIIACYKELDEITSGRLTIEMHMPLCLWPHEFIQMLKNKQQIVNVCHVLKRGGVIFDADGKFIICNGLFDYPIGQYGKDFNDAKSFKYFINNQQIVSYYDRLVCYPSQECITCKMYNDCGGGCPLKWAVYKPNELIKSTERR